MRALPLVVSLILVLKDVDGVPEPTHRDTDTQSTHKLGYTKKATLLTKSPHKHLLDGICMRACDHTHTHKHSKRTKTLAFMQIPYLHQELLNARDLTQCSLFPFSLPHTHTHWCWRSVSAKLCFRHLFLRLLMKGCYTHMHTKPMKCRCANRRSLDTVVM